MSTSIDVGALNEDDVFWAFYKCRKPKQFVVKSNIVHNSLSQYHKWTSREMTIVRTDGSNKVYKVTGYDIPKGYNTEVTAIIAKEMEKTGTVEYTLNRMKAVMKTLSNNKRTPQLKPVLQLELERLQRTCQSALNDFDKALFNFRADYNGED